MNPDINTQCDSLTKYSSPYLGMPKGRAPGILKDSPAGCPGDVINPKRHHRERFAQKLMVYSHKLSGPIPLPYMVRPAPNKGIAAKRVLDDQRVHILQNEGALRTTVAENTPKRDERAS